MKEEIILISSIKKTTLYFPERFELCKQLRHNKEPIDIFFAKLSKTSRAYVFDGICRACEYIKKYPHRLLDLREYVALKKKLAATLSLLYELNTFVKNTNQKRLNDIGLINFNSPENNYDTLSPELIDYIKKEQKTHCLMVIKKVRKQRNFLDNFLNILENTLVN